VLIETLIIFTSFSVLHVITGTNARAATAAESQKARPTSAFGRSNDASCILQQQSPAATNSNSFVAIMALLNDLDTQQLQRVKARCQELIA
jgi:hypothetical protein